MVPQRDNTDIEAELPFTVDGLRELARQVYGLLAAQRSSGRDAPDFQALLDVAQRRMPGVFTQESGMGQLVSMGLLRTLQMAFSTPVDEVVKDEWVEAKAEEWLVAIVERLQADGIGVPGGVDLVAKIDRPTKISVSKKQPGVVDVRTDYVIDPDSDRMLQLRIRSSGSELEILSRNAGATEFVELGRVPQGLRRLLIEVLEAAAP